MMSCKNFLMSLIGWTHLMSFGYCMKTRLNCLRMILNLNSDCFLMSCLSLKVNCMSSQRNCLGLILMNLRNWIHLNCLKKTLRSYLENFLNLRKNCSLMSYSDCSHLSLTDYFLNYLTKNFLKMSLEKTQSLSSMNCRNFLMKNSGRILMNY